MASSAPESRQACQPVPLVAERLVDLVDAALVLGCHVEGTRHSRPRYRYRPWSVRISRARRSRTYVPLAPLTTLRIGPVARRLITCDTTEKVVDVLRALRADEPDARVVVLAGGSNVVIADDLDRPHRRPPGEHRDHGRRRRPARRGGRAVGRRRRHLARLRPRRPGVPVRHPGLRGRDAGAERRRLRRRGGRHHQPGATARPPYRRGPLGEPGRARLRLSPQRAEELAATPSCSRSSSRWTPTGAARRCATASWRRHSASNPVRARTRPGSVRPSWRCGRSKGMVLDDGRPRHVERRLLLHQPGRHGGRRSSGSGPAIDGPVPNYPAPDGVKLAAGWLVERAGFGKGYPGDGRPRGCPPSTRWR